MKPLYHVSKIPNLTVLEPRVGTHGKAYVYATENLELALLFGSSKSYGDFDGFYGTTNNGVPFFYEAYKGAFKRRFEGETCYIYEVERKNFVSGKTSFKSEVVSEKPVKILNCTKVENLYQYLLKLSQTGKLDLHLYSNDKAYQKMIEEHIKDRIIRFGILNDTESESYKICKEKFPKYVKDLESQKS